ncbi:hypothetical protein SAMN03159338_0190 [Sphingomonas sp. NFR04]|nr:hypothetical protein SAMN03159338_0190 [Sphingomonas sp. NFR04]
MMRRPPVTSDVCTDAVAECHVQHGAKSITMVDAERSSVCGIGIVRERAHHLHGLAAPLAHVNGTYTHG